MDAILEGRDAITVDQNVFFINNSHVFYTLLQFYYNNNLWGFYETHSISA
jgi:hypothetical protein